MAPSVAARAQPRVKAAPLLKLSKCAIKYALALSDPFNPAARGVCVPVEGAPSHKTHGFIRFDVTIGTGGFGAVLLAPCLANDLPSVFFTTSTFGGGPGTPLQPWATAGTFGTSNATLNAGWAFANHNGPYSAITLTQNNLQSAGTGMTYGKMVAAGLRTQYVGTTLNESGLYTCYHEGSHASLSGASANNLQSFADADITAVTRTPCSLSIFAVNPLELVYGKAVGRANNGHLVEQLYPFSLEDSHWSDAFNGQAGKSPVIGPGSVYAAGVPVGATTFTGVPGQVIHCEMIFHMEYSGVAAAANLTDNEPDMEGVAMVQQAALNIPAQKFARPKDSPWQIMHSCLKKVASAALPYVVPAAEAALTALLL